MKTTIVSSAEGEILSLSESLTIGEADALRGAFRDLVAAGKGPVIVDLEGVTSVDITFFQLLVSLKKTLAQSDRSLTVRGMDSEGSVGRTAELVGVFI